MRVFARHSLVVGGCALFAACALVDALGGQVDQDGGAVRDALGRDAPKEVPRSDAGGLLDARPDAPAVAVNAQHLGQLCHPEPCPPGYLCVMTSEGKALCTLPCSAQDGDKTCLNGYMGPGRPTCAATGVMDENLCFILCGAQWNLPPDCPPGLTCQDLYGEMGTPDGKPDLCAP